VSPTSCWYCVAHGSLPSFLHDALPIFTGFLPDGATAFTNAEAYLSLVMRLLIAFGLAFLSPVVLVGLNFAGLMTGRGMLAGWRRSEEHTSELQSRENLVCRLLREKKNG